MMLENNENLVQKVLGRERVEARSPAEYVSSVGILVCSCWGPVTPQRMCVPGISIEYLLLVIRLKRC